MSAIKPKFDEIAAIQFTESQRIVYQKMISIIAYFFTRASKAAVRPFRGFLLEGPPASGKTEVALQVAKTLESKLSKMTPPQKVTLRFIDSSVIAAPHWGEAERRLASAFPTGTDGKEKRVLLVDDIDCLMITRGAEIAKEWHYSINSVIFHRLDFMDPTEAIVIATTNRSELVDEALRSRLYSLQVLLPKKEELVMIAQQMALNLGVGEEAQRIAKTVTQRLEILENPSIRQVQHFLIEECIESGLWRAQI